MNIELLTAMSALAISVGGIVFNYIKLKSNKDDWQEGQRIALEKEILQKKLDKRYSSYQKVFSILGKVRDITYPPIHHEHIKKNKKIVIHFADELMDELYGDSGLFMEYETRSNLLKVYQLSYKYAEGKIELSELIDAYYYARRSVRMDLQFDDQAASKQIKQILQHTKVREQTLKIQKEKSFWEIPNILARSSRPGYPDQSVSQTKVDATIASWKEKKIKSILCLLSSDEMDAYYTKLDMNLIDYYKKYGFKIIHIDIKDFQTPVLSKDEEAKVKDAYTSLIKPVLVHCGAGEDRTGRAVEILKHLSHE